MSVKHLQRFDSESSSGFTIPLSRVMYTQHISIEHPELGKNFGHNQLQNSNEYAYTVALGVGGQLFEAIFDTGSSDLWIVSSDCSNADCQRIRRYSPTPSLTLPDVDTLFNLTYLSGTVQGIVAYETVEFGPYMVFSQVLALANNTMNMGLSFTGVSGVLGLAHPAEASIPISTGRTLLDNIFASLGSSERLFSYKLSADASSSSFSVGQIDPLYSDRVSEIDYSPVYISERSNYDYWKIPLLSISIDGVPVPSAISRSKIHGSVSPIAVLDTGTTLILGPSHDVDNFWTAAGGAQKGEDGRWKVRCNHALLVGFVLGNDSTRREIVLDPSDINWVPPAASLPADGWCLGGIQSNDGVFSGDWLFGDVFLRNVYVVHTAASEIGPPLVGLLGTTNVSDALFRFQHARGNDTIFSSAPELHTGMLFRHRTRPRAGVVFAVTLISAFLGGAVLAILFRSHRERKVR